MNNQMINSAQDLVFAALPDYALNLLEQARLVLCAGPVLAGVDSELEQRVLRKFKQSIIEFEQQMPIRDGCVVSIQTKPLGDAA